VADGVLGNEVLIVEVVDRVALMTMNRPEARNALSQALVRTLGDTVAQLEDDDDVDVMILTGADPAFSAGMDLKELGGTAPPAPAPAPDRPPGSAPARPPADRRTQRGPFPPHTKLLIGAVNGVAVTGGLEVALNCDFLVASERARFADTHARVGIMPGWGLTVLLCERVGVTRAREMSVTGNYVDAPTALQWGLVNHVVTHDELIPFTRQLALDSVNNDQRSVRRMLQTYGEVSGTTVDEGWAIEVGVSVAWEGSGFDQTDVESRRKGILERGRAQISAEGGTDRGGRS
jgi:enoyl-CoA hydratase